ncbi:hypothetical protein PVAR5_8140 [Paecilomyces variotii No. 5]|uniref:C2H2-type domain-containing protein n=1 Tax=Byssochlamys spectabilis (strain No. 5 / NBRC 109023) TaxID=1356009 RepID=V5I5M5_BYSSN|nr:hypothetical protein PVAR5_8140 [Paecilomyces variotii No. 5]
MSDFVDEFSLGSFQRMLDSDDVNIDDWINPEVFDYMTSNGDGLQGSGVPFDQAVQLAQEEIPLVSDYDNSALTVNGMTSQEYTLGPESVSRGVSGRGDVSGEYANPSAACAMTAPEANQTEDFVFTPHARVLEDRRPKGKGRTYLGKQDTSERHKCDWPNCEKTFTRKADARCYRTGNEGFIRPYNLKDHVRRMHDSDTFFRCPQQGCKTEPMESLQLRVHIYSHHGVRSDYSLAGHMDSLLLSRCPFPQCKMEQLHPLSFRFHLEDHPKEDRLANSEEIWRAGYDAENCWPIPGCWP